MAAPAGNYQEVLHRIEKASHPDGEITVAQTLVFGERDFPLLKIILGKGNPKRVLLSAGIHGDEPAGVETGGLFYIRFVLHPRPYQHQRRFGSLL